MADDYMPVVPVIIPDLDEVREFAYQLHATGKEWRGEVFGWQAEYNPQRSDPPLDSKMKFTPADLLEKVIFGFSLLCGSMEKTKSQ